MFVKTIRVWLTTFDHSKLCNSFIILVADNLTLIPKIFQSDFEYKFFQSNPIDIPNTGYQQRFDCLSQKQVVRRFRVKIFYTVLLKAIFMTNLTVIFSLNLSFHNWLLWVSCSLKIGGKFYLWDGWNMGNSRN